MGKSRKGTWWQALSAFLLPLVILGFIRWAVIEPFVIPSGSMIPNLLIHDHVLVKKYSYGLKVPFTDIWILQWAMPNHGDVVVFKYPENTSVYYIKRLIGLPGDSIRLNGRHLEVNGKSWTLESIEDFPNGDPEFDYYYESSGAEKHIVRFRKGTDSSIDELKLTLKDDEYFFMGDNRDESHDSRFWGQVQKKWLVAPAWKVLLGCEETLTSNSMLCDPSTIRWNRIWKDIGP